MQDDVEGNDTLGFLPDEEVQDIIRRMQESAKDITRLTHELSKAM